MNPRFRLAWIVVILAISFVPAALADEYLVYNDLGLPASSDVYIWCHEETAVPPAPCGFAQNNTCATPEGTNYFQDQSLQWAGFGVFHLNFNNTPPTPRVADLSNFLGGEIRFWVKSAHELTVEFQCNGVGHADALTGHGWNGAFTWQEIVIPLADFSGTVNVACLQTVNAPFMATGANTPTNFLIDHVRWTTTNTHSGPSQVTVQGRQLMVNGEPFVVNGVAYNPISIGENFTGALRDRPDRYNVDFPIMAANGINTVRVYNTFLNTAMLDAAWANGLYVIPNFGVDATKLACPEGRAYMRDRLVEKIEALKDHPAILFWLVGNEINTNAGTASLCDAATGWFSQLDALAEAAHLAEDPTYPTGTSYHPVATANEEIGDICMAGCSDDTALQHVDLWGAQIYRGCGLLGAAFVEYEAKADCSRPLVITEFGADSWDSLSGPSGAESQTMQANCFDLLLDDANQALAVRTPGGVSSGQVVFSWADEWWKSECDPGTSWTAQDTCTSWTQAGYTDPAINEEWWGLVSIDAADPVARNPRTAAGTVADAWQPGTVCNVDVAGFDHVTGNTAITFDPAPGSTDHTIHYGPLSAVSTYGYTGEVAGLGADGSSSFTLSGPGSLFWLVVGRNNAAEGGYGTGIAERPADPGAAVPQDPNRTDLCSTP